MLIKQILKNNEFFCSKEVDTRMYCSLIFFIVQCLLFIGAGAGAGEKNTRSRQTG